MDFTFFNPHSQSEADFLAGFVARHDVLDYFVRQLRGLKHGQPARHHLIVAPRGYGKTSLLRRIGIALRSEADLATTFIALSFREEQHNVISLDVFWRNCLQSLAEAREDEQAPAAEIEQLDAATNRHAPRQALKREEQDGNPAWQEFRSHCERLGRRPVLLIDNLDSLLAGLPSRSQWSLREVLQREDGPVLIAAAPRFPGSTHDPAAAFYDFFRTESLDKLSDQEVMRCLRALAIRRGDSGRVVLELLDKDPGRIGALNALSGGNPRTLSVLYSVLESHMSSDVLSQLSAMLDTFTSWYQSRTDDLPLQARAVFDALALNWDPMTAAAVGAVTGLDTTSVSSQISRLEKAGFVEAVSLSRQGKGRNGYQLSERFFNIWYLMRNGPRRARQSIRFLAVFLQSCFSVTERRTMARMVLTQGRANPSYALGLAASLHTSRLRERLLDYAERQSNLAGAGEEYGPAINEMRMRERSGRAKRRSAESENERILAARALFDEGFRLGQLGRSEAAIEVYETVATRFGEASETALREQAAKAIFNKGITLGELGRSDEEIEVYDTMVTRYGDAPEAALREPVARALVNKGYRLSQLGRSEAAIEVYENVVMRFGDASETILRKQVAMALVNKGSMLGRLGRSEEEIEVYDTVVTRFGDASEAALCEPVAKALVNKGITLGQLGRSVEEIEVYDTVVTRFGDAPEAALRESVARSLVNRSSTLGQLGRSEDAIEVCDTVISRFGNAPEATLRESVARALVNKCIILDQLGRPDDAIEVCDTVVSRFGGASEAGLRESVARVLVNKGIMLGQLGRFEEEMKVYDTVVARAGDALEAGLRELVARALVNKGIVLGQLGQSEDAIEICDAVVVRFGDAREAAVREAVAMALTSKGIMLGQLGRSEEEIELYDAVVTRFGGAPEAALGEAVSWSLVNKGRSLGQVGRTDEAEAALRRVAMMGTPETRGKAWNTLGNLLLDQAGNPGDALAAFESGLSVDGQPKDRAQLHANYAYALALHGHDLERALDHARQAMADGEILSVGGRHLLGALSCLQEPSASRWQCMFEQIGLAVESQDPDLWTNYVDDLQRLLWFVIAQGEGEAFRRWMNQADYSQRYAPLYHAVVAAIDGEDHLLRINPETRHAAERIYEGIARRLKLYAGEARGIAASSTRKKSTSRR